MVTQKLRNAVRKEVIALRKEAKEKELNRLSIKKFEPGHMEQCIYGQMTGHCLSPRAIELIGKCCVKMSADLGSPSELLKKDGKMAESRNLGLSTTMWSALECYIYNHRVDDKQIQGIFNYLKGKTDKFRL